jgi:hypothetical protein
MSNQGKNRLEQKPLIVVVGGLVAGGVAAALLPRSTREHNSFAPMGRQLRRRVNAAVREAHDVAIDRLDNLGINRDSASAQLRNLAEVALETAALAGVAALRAARDKRAKS